MTAARDRLPRTGWISTENTLSPGRGGFSVLTWERGTDLAQTGSSGLPEVENTYFEKKSSRRTLAVQRRPC